ncbi:uncharacterized protein LOC142348408 [Convolutriloba macropyga]|uniref:uncharacterized protein LOC142348408 n=1 Tax=Convolutriloba macropyga TaxID=536237 RepID=UPI003F526E76
MEVDNTFITQSQTTLDAKTTNRRQKHPTDGLATDSKSEGADVTEGGSVVKCEFKGYDKWVALTDPYPTPFAVISERNQTNLAIPDLPEEEMFSFGELYESSVANLIVRHSDLIMSDSVAYVGSARGSLAPMIQTDLDLIDPIACFAPLKTHVKESAIYQKDCKPYVYEVAEEYFEKNAKSPEADRVYYDKIIVMDCILHVADMRRFLKSLKFSLSKEGIILVLHRAGALTTLPLFSRAKQMLKDEESDRPYIDIMKTLQNVRCDVEWEIETAPIRMSQSKWLFMMKNRFPSGGFLDSCSDSDVGYGLRELIEGILKYQGPEVEFYDRLLVVSATHQLPSAKIPIIQRSRDKNQIADLFNLPYKLKVDDNVEKILAEQEAEKKRTSTMGF